MKAIIEFNLPEDQEQYNVSTRAMDWALLVWELDNSIRNLLKYHPEEYKTSTEALEHIRRDIVEIMEEKGLQFPV